MTIASGRYRNAYPDRAAAQSHFEGLRMLCSLSAATTGAADPCGEAREPGSAATVSTIESTLPKGQSRVSRNRLLPSGFRSGCRSARDAGNRGVPSAGMNTSAAPA